jgi:hypothetical protein
MPTMANGSNMVRLHLFYSILSNAALLGLFFWIVVRHLK